METVTQNLTIQDLKYVVGLSNLPDDHLQWILDHAEYSECRDGDLIAKTGEPVDRLWIILEGTFEFYMNFNGKLVHYYTFCNDERTGGIFGLMPYSRMKVAPGNNYASGNARILSLHKKYFSELEQLNPEFIQRLIGYMTERARHFATQQSQQEKVSALGKLAAGVAHELNNPASAINGIASELKRKLDQSGSTTLS
jgi:signal-transduction protein with cAMP-binding, CBS, and nucleotidyltransferase domain